MARFAVFDTLNAEDRRRTLARMVRHRYRRNEVLFHEGDPGNTFHIIDAGHVKISVLSPLGNSATLAILGPGEFFGEQALLSPEASRTATATAMEGAVTLALAAAEFRDLRRRHLGMNDLLVDVLAAQVRRLSEQVMEARFLPSDQRIARQLVRLAGLYGSEAPIEIPFAQQEIADLTGTTRPTVNRFLQSLPEAIEVTRGRITVTSLEALRARR